MCEARGVWVYGPAGVIPSVEYMCVGGGAEGECVKPEECGCTDQQGSYHQVSTGVCGGGGGRMCEARGVWVYGPAGVIPSGEYMCVWGGGECVKPEECGCTDRQGSYHQVSTCVCGGGGECVKPEECGCTDRQGSYHQVSTGVCGGGGGQMCEARGVWVYGPAGVIPSGEYRCVWGGGGECVKPEECGCTDRQGSYHQVSTGVCGGGGGRMCEARGVWMYGPTGVIPSGEYRCVWGGRRANV